MMLRILACAAVVALVYAQTASQNCRRDVVEIEAVFNYTNAPEFGSLSQRQQIFIYESLAASEACKLTGFLNPTTMQRTLQLLQELPLKYVYLYIGYLSKSLEVEGVVVPQ
ncbi:uncharacterized protein LOC112572138 [Pomacea canaliculata]|uniref:uncharacterized protein LOC112572138 n=1 Tax=Pomacea canaliculata TaxID=400727 RepID=UPI000D735A31|nr:uncharacterized protein LOC112572138 [Pomacea canaliculata]